MTMQVDTFFEKVTGTAQYIVTCTDTKRCAIIDSVLDYTPNDGRTQSTTTDLLIDHVRNNNLTVEWILETHAHADHLSASQLLKKELGGKTGIGANITTVQKVFKNIFDIEDEELPTDGTQWDALFKEGDEFKIGNITVQVLHTPGHTPACISYYVPDQAVFVGDTIFMPDMGTARCDFPGGSATTIWASIQKVLALPDHVKIYVGHDYSPGGREPKWETTVGDTKANNIHVAGSTEEAFVEKRTTRDATLGAPRLIIPSIQVNIRAGHFPSPSPSGKVFLKTPVNVLGAPSAPTPPQLTHFASSYAEKQAEAAASLPFVTKLSPELFAAGQISPEDLHAVAAAGVKTVLNLRLEGEEGFDEKEGDNVTALGMKYFHIPVKPSALDHGLIDDLLYTLDDVHKPILIHCKAGPRAKAVAAMHITTRGVLSKSDDPVDLVKKADELGIDKIQSAPIQSFVRKYISERAHMASAAPGLTQVSANLWVAPQVTDEELKEVANRGFKTVINLRSPDEQGFNENEKELVEGLGMKYHLLPLKVLENEKITTSSVDEALKLLDSAPTPILMHCRRMNRSAAVTAIHLHKSEGKPMEETAAQLHASGSRASSIPAIESFMKRYQL